MHYPVIRHPPPSPCVFLHFSGLGGHDGRERGLGGVAQPRGLGRGTCRCQYRGDQHVTPDHEVPSSSPGGGKVITLSCPRREGRGGLQRLTTAGGGGVSPTPWTQISSFGKHEIYTMKI